MAEMNVDMERTIPGGQGLSQGLGQGPVPQPGVGPIVGPIVGPMPAPGYAMLPGAMPNLGAIPAGAPVAEPKPREGRAIAALVLGIISIVAALLPICGLPFSVAGIVVSLLARRSASNRTMATVGLVLASIALGLTLLNAAAGIYLALHAR